MGYSQHAYDYDRYAYELPEVKPSPIGRPSQKKQQKLNHKPVPAARYAIMILVFVLINVLLVCRHNVILQRGYELTQMKKELVTLQTDNQRLALQVGQMESLDRIETAALGRMGMIRTNQVRLVTVSSSNDVNATVAHEGNQSPSLWSRFVAALLGESTQVEAGSAQVN